MGIHRSASIVVVALALGLPASATAGEPASAALAEAIAAAREGGGPFRLRVDSLSAAGVRSLELFPSGVGIWNGRLQLRPDAALRRALLGALIEGGFPELAATYGGRLGGSQEGAALRVIRRIELELGGLAKSSVQLAEGEQSAALERLAETLLDLAATLVPEGVGADDLSDGLAKLAAGNLAPESFTLRFVELPPPGSGEAGSILRIAAGIATRQLYAPGREIGVPVPLALDAESWAGLLEAFRTAELANLPLNLWAEGQLELEVAVLEHRRTIVARPFSRLSPADRGPAQLHFEALAAALRAF